MMHFHPTLPLHFVSETTGTHFPQLNMTLVYEYQPSDQVQNKTDESG